VLLCSFDSELFTLLHFIDPVQFLSESEFNAQFGVLEKSTQVQQLQEKLAPYLLRRMKEDVAKGIPPKEETVRSGRGQGPLEEAGGDLHVHYSRASAVRAWECLR